MFALLCGVLFACCLFIRLLFCLSNSVVMILCFDMCGYLLSFSMACCYASCVGLFVFLFGCCLVLCVLTDVVDTV